MVMTMHMGVFGPGNLSDDASAANAGINNGAPCNCKPSQPN